MDHSKFNNLVIQELQLQNAELNATVERLTKIAFAFQAKIDELEETIQQEFPRETPTAESIAESWALLMTESEREYEAEEMRRREWERLQEENVELISHYQDKEDAERDEMDDGAPDYEWMNDVNRGR